MAKRRRDEDEGEASNIDQNPKRTRLEEERRLSSLSDELLLRILSFLPVTSLCTCERISRRFSRIARDNEVWRLHYFNRFVILPRLEHRIGDRRGGLLHSTSMARFLDKHGPSRRSRQTNWKRQYKLRDNWSRGSCAITEIPVAEKPSQPPLLARLHGGIVVTVDMANGLRAWSTKVEQAPLAEASLSLNEHQAPTSLAVEVKTNEDALDIPLAVGFADGSFTVFQLDRRKEEFVSVYTHEPSSNGAVTAVALASPYLLTMTAGQLLSLYIFPSTSTSETPSSSSPRLLASLRSHTAVPPLSLSLRPLGSKILASVAYALPTFLGGWAVGLQEIHLSLTGDILATRLASSLTGSATALRMSATSLDPRSSSIDAGLDEIEASTSRLKPTSISYNHPYLLLGHADNTLTLYLVTSTATSLTISNSSRLWGHTSSVSSAHVSGRGKAVSVSLHGDELRVWELEGGMSSPAMRKKLSTGELSVKVRSRQKPVLAGDDLSVLSDAIEQRGTILGLALEMKGIETNITRGWVGFDDENVVVLREKSGGSQALVVYDFT